MRQTARRATVSVVLLALATCADDPADSPNEKAAAPSLTTAASPDPTLLRLIADARAAAGPGDAVWPGYAAAPFQLVLVTAESDVLVCPEGPAETFAPLGEDAATGCALKRRDRTFDPSFLASFPAVDGISTIVVGTPQETGLTGPDWAITLLHEHFHQMQYSSPGYYDGTLALDLDGGDQTGMWMLNYPFPYDAPAAAAAFSTLARAALATIETGGSEDFDARVRAYLQARAAFLDTLDEADRRYFEFQLWQEGVARWSEAEVALASGQPVLEEAGAASRRGVRTSLARVAEAGLPAWGRTAFYPLGAAEAEILDRLAPGWRDRYWETGFAMAPLFPAMAASPAAGSD